MPGAGACSRLIENQEMYDAAAEVLKRFGDFYEANELKEAFDKLCKILKLDLLLSAEEVLIEIVSRGPK